MDIKESIINQAQKIGIDLIGFTTCEPFEDIREALCLRQKKGYLSGFEESNIEKRIDPHYLFKDCCTIISVGISYNINSKALKQEGRGTLKNSIARASWGEDYHNVLNRMLSELGEFIKYKYNASYKVFVDTNPLPEREAAHRAGIGFIGKNGFIINPVYGSFIFMGELITDIYIEPDKPIECGCGECKLCIDACPSGALVEPLLLNAKECISYITQSKEINNIQCKKIGSSVYGCDICQLVCPVNRKALFSDHLEFSPEEWNISPDIMDILKMDNKKYNSTFKKTSSGWRGKKILQRNAIIALGNSGDKSNVCYIVDMLSDNRQDIRKACIYALYNLLGCECKEILKEHIKVEKDPETINIINEIYRIC